MSKLVAQLSPKSDETNENMDATQGAPGPMSPPMPNSKASMQPKAINPIKKKKPIKSIAELKAIAAKIKPKGPMGGM